jgi:hypothetical protein
MAERAKANRGGKGKRERTRKSNGAARVGHNSGSAVALQEVTDRWLPKISAARAKYEKAAEVARTAKGQLGQIYEAAVNDGLNLRGLKRGIELLRRDATEVVAEEEQVSRVLRSNGSVLIEQYELFPLAKAVKPVNPYLRGQADGKAAAPRDVPAEYKPGSEDADLYLQGWDSGQQQNADALRGDHAPAN